MAKSIKSESHSISLCWYSLHSDYLFKNKRYFLTMQNHFTKFRWCKFGSKKFVDAVLKAIKEWVDTHRKFDILQSDKKGN